ncbi:MAG: glycoside hydrolase family 31 protein [Algoriphagus sp.]|nr:glycoside hydrolase family 31 protein [Algoriphagus sp.]
MNDSNTTSTNSRNSFRHQAFGKVLTWTKTPNGLSGSSDFANFKLTVFETGIVRVQASKFESFESNPYSVVVQPKSIDYNLEEFEDKLILSTGILRVVINLQSFSLAFFDQHNKLLNQDDSFGVAWIGTEVTTYKNLQPNEKFIGLGEKTGNLNRFGNAYIHWNTDYFAYGVGDDPLYLSIPFYLGVHRQGHYGIFLDNTHKSLFNFGASNNRFTSFSAEDGDMDYYFFHYPSISEIITAYTWLTGRMQMPPKWALGFQQCRYSYYPESEVYAVAQAFRDKKMPADVIYLDIHHMEAYKVFTFDGEKFPNPKAMITRLKEKGFKVVVILDPGIKTEESYSPFREGLEQGLFVNYPDGKTYEAQVWPGWCAFPDFTKPATRSWWEEKMAFYTEAGVDGFWTDMNEPASWGQCTPNLLEFDFEGEKASHRKARNVFGMQMARSTQAGAGKQAPKKRPFVLTRSGFAGIQRFAAAWTGDNVASEEHMLAGIRLVNSLGMSGISFAGYDVGGFAGEASKGLFARWMSIAAFSPLYRAHSMINTKDAEPWAFGEEVEEISRNYLNFRYSLLPTIYSAFHQSTQNGLPLAASLAIHYPQDETIYQTAFQNEYLFCNSFLVAPVESFREISKVYLPQGEWYYLYTDQKHQGGQVIYQDSPLNYLPVFVHAGKIVAQQSPTQHTEMAPDSTLNLHLYRGSTGSTYIHYEDAGEGLGYLEGEFFSREIQYQPENGSLKIEQAKGQQSSQYAKIRLFFHGFERPNPQVNGTKQDLKSTNFAFLDKLTEFDPLPDQVHPYFQIKQLPYIEFAHTAAELEIKGLD